ncbi:MAG: hypothetical protein HY270_12420 [Deltaproteobacteria bacterium]|nr:hypothetical protein [Deltaproteobacteria bacterium]
MDRRINRSAIVLAVAVAFAANALAAETVGNIIRCDLHVAQNDGSGWVAVPSIPPPSAQATQLHRPQVRVGSALLTDPVGRASVFFSDPRFPVDRREFEMGPKTHVEVAAMSEQGLGVVRLKLPVGKLHWIGPDGWVETPNATVKSTKTEFVVSYDPDTRVTEILGVTGEVTVRNRAGGTSLRVGERRSTNVVAGAAPSPVTEVGESEVRQQLKTFELIGGGRPESQTALFDGIVDGRIVPAPDLAPHRQPPSIPDYDWYRRQAEYPPFEQPPAAVSRVGLGIDF